MGQRPGNREAVKRSRRKDAPEWQPANQTSSTFVPPGISSFTPDELVRRLILESTLPGAASGSRTFPRERGSLEASSVARFCLGVRNRPSSPVNGSPCFSGARLEVPSPPASGAAEDDNDEPSTKPADGLVGVGR